MIQLVGSKVVTRRPSTIIDLDSEGLSNEEKSSSNEATPRVHGPAGSTLSASEDDIYQTPVALTPANWKNKGKIMAHDTEVESSESDTQVETSTRAVANGREERKKEWLSKASSCYRILMM